MPLRSPALAGLILPPLALLFAIPAAAPCAAPVGLSAETLLAQAQIARRLAGTESVTLDPSRSCITIAVRTPGTARLVELLLRGVDVPLDAVRFQVDSSRFPTTGARRT